MDRKFFLYKYQGTNIISLLIYFTLFLKKNFPNKFFFIENVICKTYLTRSTLRTNIKISSDKVRDLITLSEFKNIRRIPNMFGVH